MNAFKRLFSLLLCIAVVTAFPFVSSAETRNIKIKVASVTAVPDDEIVVNVDTVENDGVMAMTFALSYDPKVLSYKDFDLGIFNDYTVVDHPESGYVSFVNCEKKDRKYCGNILAFRFTVKSDAPAGVSPLKIVNIRPETYGESLEGCFATWDSLTVVPTVENGSVTVGETCSNSGHKYGKWKTVTQPLCETEGTNSRSCTECGHTEYKSVKALGHDFADEWTVDTPATATEKGVMTRHCKRCDKTTDRVSFTAEDAKAQKFDNTGNAVVSAEKWDKLEKKLAESKKEEKEPDNQTEKDTDNTVSEPENSDSTETVAPKEEKSISVKSLTENKILRTCLPIAVAILAVAVYLAVLAIKKKNK